MGDNEYNWQTQGRPHEVARFSVEGVPRFQNTVYESRGTMRLDNISKKSDGDFQTSMVVDWRPDATNEQLANENTSHLVNIIRHYQMMDQRSKEQIEDLRKLVMACKIVITQQKKDFQWLRQENQMYNGSAAAYTYTPNWHMAQPAVNEPPRGASTWKPDPSNLPWAISGKPVESFEPYSNSFQAGSTLESGIATVSTAQNFEYFQGASRMRSRTGNLPWTAVEKPVESLEPFPIALHGASTLDSGFPIAASAQLGKARESFQPFPGASTSGSSATHRPLSHPDMVLRSNS